MSLFTDDEVADLWAEHVGGHRETLHLKATVETALDTHTWPAITQTVKGTVLDRPSSAVGQTGEIEVIPSARQKTIVLPRGTTVAPSWRIVWADEGLTYEVDDVERAGSYGPAVYCLCTEVPA